ncbi:MAG: TonB family protein [Acidimicrobiia bacterium]|nr:TonB family protein [Acidimicrobiia bacterium]
MGEPLLVNLLLYSAQIACVTVLGGGLALLLRPGPPSLRHRFWQGLLAVCLLLPWLQGRQPPPATMEHVDAAVLAWRPADGPPDFRFATPPPELDWSSTAGTILVAGGAARSAWLAVAWLRLRRLRRRGVAPGSFERSAVPAGGRRTDIRLVPGLQQPITFGAWEPVVLLPDGFQALAPGVQQAVLCHELLHVERRDWLWLLAEEGVRTVFWFHPAIWWLVARIRGTREETVDRLVVQATGDRRTYVTALLAFADDAPPTPAPAFSRRSHLFRRIVLISQEAVMSRTRLFLALTTIAVALSAGAWYSVSALPLRQAASARISTSPGPLELQAKTVTPENPVPRRTDAVAPRYPQRFAASGVYASLTLRVTLDATGRVAEIRPVRADYSNARAGATAPADTTPFVEAAVSAVNQWRYDPPIEAPLVFEVSLRFTPDTDGVMVNAAGAPMETPAWHEGALRVGQHIQQPPAKVLDVRPVYPMEAQNAGVQGIVILEVRIEADGRVSHTRVLRSIPQLDQAATDAVKQWEFQPALLNGALVPVVMAITVQFTLSR